MIQFWRKLPYCVKRVGDRTYEVFDRDYQRIDKFQLERELLPVMIDKMQGFPEMRNDSIYLYNDGCKPCYAWKQYQSRLQVLALVKINDKPPPVNPKERFFK